ncbi:hypothetical protein [Roseibium sediminis]|uniref:hypothetical protein n=1 Tax=Roseibium sediminis TaxID=1775174 RepID=UPI00123D061A|nr:hypothetical protein [Roseibium sediminis]
MTHIRQRIRDKAVNLLSNLPTTGNRCYSMRTYPTDRDKPPCLLVYTLREASDTDSLGDDDRDLQRRIELTVEAQARGRDFDDTLDAIAAEVETVLFQNRTFDGLAIDSTLTQTALELGDGENNRRSGVLTLTYSVLVIGPEGNPH